MSSVRHSDQRSGFRDPVLNSGVSSLHFHNHGVFEVLDKGVTPWLVAVCHLSAQHECVNSFEGHDLFNITLVYHPEEHVCLL